MLQKTYSNPRWGPSVIDEKLLRLIPLNSEIKVPKELSETWFRTFHLIATPYKILDMESAGNSDHLSLSFFLSVLVHVRLIDIIYGDTEVSMNFQESEEVHQLWQDACRELQDEWSKSYHHHRLSNLSNSSIPHSASMENTPTAQSSTASAVSTGSVGRKNALIIPGSRQMMRASTRNHPFSIHKEPASAPVIIDEPQPQFCEPARPKLGQFVYHYLKTNQFRRIKRSTPSSMAVNSNVVLDVFLYFLGDAAQASPLQYSIRHPQQQGQEGEALLFIFLNLLPATTFFSFLRFSSSFDVSQSFWLEGHFYSFFFILFLDSYLASIFFSTSFSPLNTYRVFFIICLKVIGTK